MFWVQMEQKFDHFCKTFAVPRSLAKFVRAVWLLDHGNLQVCVKNIVVPYWCFMINIVINECEYVHVITN